MTYTSQKPTLSCHEAPGARNLLCLEWIRFTGTVNGSGGSTSCISSGSSRLYLDKLIVFSSSQAEDVWLHDWVFIDWRSSPNVTKYTKILVTSFVENSMQNYLYIWNIIWSNPFFILLWYDYTYYMQVSMRLLVQLCCAHFFILLHSLAYKVTISITFECSNYSQLQHIDYFISL